MLYNIYFSTKRLRQEEGIWIYHIYEDNRNKILEDDKYMPRITCDFNYIPIYAALLQLVYPLQNCNGRATIMTNDTTVKDLINMNCDIDQFPVFKKYYSKFKKILNRVGVASMPTSLYIYITSGMFYSNQSYDWQKKLEKSLRIKSKEYC